MCGTMLVNRLRTIIVASMCECLRPEYNVGANKTLFKGVFKLTGKLKVGMQGLGIRSVSVPVN